MAQDYGLGRLPSRDERDGLHRMAVTLAGVSVPRRWRYWRTGPVLDQGSAPQCVGYAWRQWIASAPLMTKDGPTAPEIYTAAQFVDEWPGEGYDGTSVRAAAKVLQGLGRVGEYVWAETWQQVRDWVLTRGPVVLGTDWYSAMFTPDEGGGVHLSGDIAGGHAYIAVGYTPGAFRCLNSWGPGWGQGGRFWLADSDLGFLLGHDGEACAAVEVRP